MYWEWKRYTFLLAPSIATPFISLFCSIPELNLCVFLSPPPPLTTRELTTLFYVIGILILNLIYLLCRCVILRAVKMSRRKYLIKSDAFLFTNLMFIASETNKRIERKRFFLCYFFEHTKIYCVLGKKFQYFLSFSHFFVV